MTPTPRQAPHRSTPALLLRGCAVTSLALMVSGCLSPFGLPNTYMSMVDVVKTLGIQAKEAEREQQARQGDRSPYQTSGHRAPAGTSPLQTARMTYEPFAYR